MVHAHYAVPAADALLRTRDRTPMVVSVHGGDVFHTARTPAGRARVEHAFRAARIVLANSMGIERACRDLGARTTRVVHLGTDLIPMERRPPAAPTLVTVGQLIARKRQADVLRAMWILRDRRPDLRYRIIGDGPERDALALPARQLGLEDRVEFTGPLPHAEALRRGRDAAIFVMPSTDEAFGVAYVEAMAAGLPAIGSRGEPGPEDIASLGDGMRLVPPADPEALAPRSTTCSMPTGARGSARPPSDRGRALHLGRLRRRDGRRLRGGHAAVSATRGPSCSSPTTSPRIARARSRRCTQRENVELALFGGRSHHATAAVEDPGVPHRAVSQREIYDAGRFRPLPRGRWPGPPGRIALPAAYAGARRARVPFVLWTALWAHPRTAACTVAGAPLLRTIYRRADATRHLRPARERVRRRARRPQRPRRAPGGRRRVLVGGRRPGDRARHPPDAPLRRVPSAAPRARRASPCCTGAWRCPGSDHPRGAHARRGNGEPGRPATARASTGRPPDPIAVRNFYAGADVLVMPAIATRDFLEPWGLVANEAMHQRLPVIATTAVGAAAGGLVRHERNGLVVPAGDAAALAGALRTLREDPALRARLGADAAQDVAAFTFDAWAAGVSSALVSVGAGQEGDR